MFFSMYYVFQKNYQPPPDKNLLMTWYTVNDIETIDSPALIVYPERVKENIRKVIEMAVMFLSCGRM